MPWRTPLGQRPLLRLLVSSPGTGDIAGEEMRVGGPGPQVKGSVGSESLDAW